ncbi:MAG: acetolactate decarboxylase [Rhodopirellula sp.]|nr:acetolactate decarboxylase [Rhodopirellula sp.]
MIGRSLTCSFSDPSEIRLDKVPCLLSVVGQSVQVITATDSYNRMNSMSSNRHQLQCRISHTLWAALESEQSRTGDSIEHIVERALANELDLKHHSLFQVSTTSALVEGVFDGCTRVHDLKCHGDFGVGTFEGLDGEMVMLDGVCYQIRAGGTAHEVVDSTPVPFATITRFVADQHFRVDQVGSFEELLSQIDRRRPSDNLFAAFRVEGCFENVSLRAACKAAPGEKLVDAIEHQSEFSATQEIGTLVGFWAPLYAKSIGVPGYHFHFINASGKFGGHVFDLSAKELQVGMHVETDIHLAIPETQQFMAANLSADPSSALERAEKDTHREQGPG